MNEYTKWMYVYRHDGGDYLGCRAQGKNWDCIHDEESDVDCLGCKFNNEKEERL